MAINNHRVKIYQLIKG